MSASFGSELRALRRAKAVSSASIAKTMGWSQAYVCMLEADRRKPPSPEKVSRILHALGADDRIPDFNRLAETTCTKVIMQLTAKIDQNVRETLLLLGDAYREGKIDSKVARSIRRALESRAVA